MTLVPDEYVLAPRVVAEFTPLVHSHLPTADLSSDGDDLFVSVPIAADGLTVPPAIAYTIARAMRGGRPPDLAAPSDWHVRSLQLVHRVTERPEHETRPRPLTGTSIWLSRSYTIPDGYDETDTQKTVIHAPGALPPRQ